MIKLDQYSDRLKDKKISLYKNLYQNLRKSIIRGEFKSGEKLPSSRELAKTLGVSRNTVVNCYEQLNAEGYIETRFGSGSFIAENAIQTPLTDSNKIKREPVFSDLANKSVEHWIRPSKYF